MNDSLQPSIPINKLKLTTFQRVVFLINILILIAIVAYLITAILGVFVNISPSVADNSVDLLRLEKSKYPYKNIDNFLVYWSVRVCDYFVFFNGSIDT
jgi:hypothetical protein